MWLTLQVALGVCAGLWLFKLTVYPPAAVRRITVQNVIAFCVAAYAAMWVMHLLFVAWR